MNKFKSLFIFTAGAITGAAVSYVVTKKKYEQILDEEIESVKETYKNRKELEVKEVETKEEPEVGEVGTEALNEYEPTPEDKQEYTKILNESGYVNYTKYMNQETEEPKGDSSVKNEVNDLPYVIDLEEFGEEEGYDTMTLTYYADKVLVDDLDDVVEDPDTVVGLENLKVFDEFGASSVYIRNDIFKVDYEVLRDDWKYSDLNQDVPSKEELQEYYRNVEREKKPHEL